MAFPNWRQIVGKQGLGATRSVRLQIAASCVDLLAKAMYNEWSTAEVAEVHLCTREAFVAQLFSNIRGAWKYANWRNCKDGSTS